MHFGHVMFHCFKKDSTPKNTAKEICNVYGDRFITVQTVRNWFRRGLEPEILIWNMKIAANIHPPLILTLSMPTSMKTQGLVFVR